MLEEGTYPLIERVMLGPLEDDAKVFIMDRDRVRDVSEEVRKGNNW